MNYVWEAYGEDSKITDVLIEVDGDNIENMTLLFKSKKGYFVINYKDYDLLHEIIEKNYIKGY